MAAGRGCVGRRLIPGGGRLGKLLLDLLELLLGVVEASLETLFALEDRVLVADRGFGLLLRRQLAVFEQQQLFFEVTDLREQFSVLVLGVEDSTILRLQLVLE